MGQSRADAPLGHGELGRIRKACGDLQSLRYPLRLATQQTRDRRRAEFLLLLQGADHASLIQGGEGARGTVGRQQQALALFGCTGLLQNHRDLFHAALLPKLQAFEAVDDFVATVRSRDNPQGQLGDVLGSRVHGAGSQRGVAGVQPLDGQPAQGPRSRFRPYALSQRGAMVFRHQRHPAVDRRSRPPDPAREARRTGRQAREVGFGWPTLRGRA